MRITVRVQTGADATRVGGRHGSGERPLLGVRVTERAVEGRANRAVITALAQAFGVPRAAVELVRGHRSRTKLIEVSGASPERLDELLESFPTRR